MRDKLETVLLEYEKSIFLIDLIKHNNGVLSVEINQTIQLEDNKYEVNKIKINPTVLVDVIAVLSNYRKVIPKEMEGNKSYFSEEKIKEVVKRYLKGGVEVIDLANQFDCKEEVIKQILRNNDIAIVSNQKPFIRNSYMNKKKK